MKTIWHKGKLQKVSDEVWECYMRQCKKRFRTPQEMQEQSEKARLKRNRESKRRRDANLFELRRIRAEYHAKQAEVIKKLSVEAEERAMRAKLKATREQRKRLVVIAETMDKAGCFEPVRIIGGHKL